MTDVGRRWGMALTSATSALLLASTIGATPALALAGLDEVNRGGLVPLVVAAELRPYGPRLMPPLQPPLVDETGVRVIRTADGRVWDHPVSQAKYGINLLMNHRATGDPALLELSILQAQRLVDRRVESRGAWFYPYRFDLDLPSRAESDRLVAPWYSGMAQGQALSLFSYLWETTGDQRWRSAADATFESLLLLADESGDPWTSHTDDDGCLWLEEYPRTPAADSERVLNGHIFAVYGAYDYWATSGDDRAAAVFDAGATTVLRHLAEFRNVGWASSYSLRSLRPNTGYHAVHIGQLLQLHALTGDRRFAEAAETFQTDYAPPLQRGNLRMLPGRHLSVTFDSNGQVTSRQTTTLRRASGASFDRRARIKGRSGWWLRVSNGHLRGRWVLERLDRRYPLGSVSTFGYRGDRWVSVADIVGTRTYPAESFGWFNGRLAVRVTLTPTESRWLALEPGRVRLAG